jgi:hypothetical protein
MKRMILSLCAVAAMFLFRTSAYSQDSREITKIVSLKADGEVSIDTYKGSIKVAVWDKAQVEIHAVIEADDNFDTKYSEEKVRDTDVRIDETENRVRIKTDYDNVRDRGHGFFSWFEDGSGSLPLVHYTITMPASARLRIKDYKSRSSVQGLRSDLDFNTYKGEVEITGLKGSLTLETYKGEARIEFNKMSNRSRCETYKGSITVFLPKDSGFDLDADLGYRTRFSTDFDFEIPDRGRRHRDLEFQRTVNGGGPLLALRSTKGSFRLRQQ